MNKFSKLVLLALVTISTLGSCTKEYYAPSNEKESLQHHDKELGEGKDTNDQTTQGTGG